MREEKNLYYRKRSTWGVFTWIKMNKESSKTQKKVKWMILWFGVKVYATEVFPVPIKPPLLYLLWKI